MLVSRLSLYRNLRSSQNWSRRPAARRKSPVAVGREKTRRENQSPERSVGMRPTRSGTARRWQRASRVPHQTVNGHRCRARRRTLGLDGRRSQKQRCVIGIIPRTSAYAQSVREFRKPPKTHLVYALANADRKCFGNHSSRQSRCQNIFGVISH